MSSPSIRSNLPPIGLAFIPPASQLSTRSIHPLRLAPVHVWGVTLSSRSFLSAVVEKFVEKRLPTMPMGWCLSCLPHRAVQLGAAKKQTTDGELASLRRENDNLQRELQLARVRDVSLDFSPSHPLSLSRCQST